MKNAVKCKAKPSAFNNSTLAAKQKAVLNKAILNAGWHRIEAYTRYKAYQACKAVFKLNAAYTNQECALCDYTHHDNRPSQASFVCGHCGHTDHADKNAALVIKKWVINLILDTGTVLTDAGVLKPQSVIGCGGKRQTYTTKSCLSSSLRSVKKEKKAV